MCRLSTRATQVTGSGTVEPTELAERPPLSRASRRTTVTVTVYGNLTLDNHVPGRLEAESTALRCSTTTWRLTSADGILLSGHQARPARLVSPRAGPCVPC